MHPFRAAVEAQDFQAIHAMLAEDVVFHSPVAFKPYQGRDLVSGILLGVSRVFEDFHYEVEIGAEDAEDHALVFAARVNDLDLQGVDFLHTGEDGLIDRFTVMVRPLSAAKALAERMAVEFAAVQQAMQAQAAE